MTEKLRELARENPEEFRNVAGYVGPKARERMLEILQEEHGVSVGESGQ